VSRTGPRFLAEAVAIVLVAVLTGAVAQLVWWAVAGCVLAVLGASFVLEAWLSRPAGPPRRVQAASAAPRLEPEDALTPHVRLLAAAPEPVETAEPALTEADLDPERLPAIMARRSWNLWEIERVLRARGRLDEERSLLLHYMREYAGPDGELPAEFDDLVRESFGDAPA
jgi:hypothetical protein